MKISKDQYKAAGLTALVTGLIILILLLMAFRTPLPLPEEQGVVIEVGGGGGGGGGSLSTAIDNPEDYKLPSEPKPLEQILTQNTEPVDYVVPENRNLSQTKPVDENVNTKTNQTSQTSSQNNQQQVDERLRNFAWGQGKGNGKGSGDGSGQGSGSGSGTGGGAGSGAGTGTGGGTGPSYSLAGRSVRNLPVPAYDEEEQGIVVVTIWVDRDGNVTRAEPGAIGTTAKPGPLWELAKEAAMRAKFNKDGDAPEIQRGTITYRFVKK